MPGGGALPLNHYLVAVLQTGAFAAKTVFFCWFLLVVRWTLPRFRYDQIMRLGWRIMLPIALLNLVVTGIVLTFIERA